MEAESRVALFVAEYNWALKKNCTTFSSSRGCTNEKVYILTLLKIIIKKECKHTSNYIN